MSLICVIDHGYPCWRSCRSMRRMRFSFGTFGRCFPWMTLVPNASRAQWNHCIPMDRTSPRAQRSQWWTACRPWSGRFRSTQRCESVIPLEFSYPTCNVLNVEFCIEIDMDNLRVPSHALKIEKPGSFPRTKVLGVVAASTPLIWSAVKSVLFCALALSVV